MAKMTSGNLGKCTGLLGVETLNHELLPGPSLRSRGCYRLEGGFWGLQRPPPHRAGWRPWGGVYSLEQLTGVTTRGRLQPKVSAASLGPVGPQRPTCPETGLAGRHREGPWRLSLTPELRSKGPEPPLVSAVLNGEGQPRAGLRHLEPVSAAHAGIRRAGCAPGPPLR